MAGIGVLAVTLPPFLAGACAVSMQRDLRLSTTALATAISCFFALTALTAPLAGRWSARWGWRACLLAGTTTSAAALLGMATLARGPLTLALCLSVAGMANAVVVPSSNAAITALVPGEHLSIAIGLTQAAVPLTGTVAGAAVPTTVAALGWRATMAAACVVALLAVLLLLVTRAHGSSPRPLRPRMRWTRRLVLFSITGAVATTLVAGLGSLYVVLTVEHGTTTAAAGFLLALGGLTGAAVRVSSGVLGRRRGPSACTVSALLLSAAIGFALLSTGSPALLVPGTMLAFAGGWGWPGTYTHLLIISHADDAAEASALVLVGLASGAVIGPTLLGWLADVGSPSLAWRGGCVLAVIAAVLSLRLYPTTPPVEQEPRTGSVRRRSR